MAKSVYSARILFVVLACLVSTGRVDAGPRRVPVYGPSPLFIQSAPVTFPMQAAPLWTTAYVANPFRVQLAPQQVFLAQADAFDAAGDESEPAKEAGGSSVAAPATPTATTSDSSTFRSSIDSTKSILCKLEKRNGIATGDCGRTAAETSGAVDWVAEVRRGMSRFTVDERRNVGAAIRGFNRSRLYKLRQAGKTLSEIARVVLDTAQLHVHEDRIVPWLDLSARIVDLLSKRVELQSAPLAASPDDDRVVEAIVRELADAVSRP